MNEVRFPLLIRYIPEEPNFKEDFYYNLNELAYLGFFSSGEDGIVTDANGKNVKLIIDNFGNSIQCEIEESG